MKRPTTLFLIILLWNFHFPQTFAQNNILSKRSVEALEEKTNSPIESKKITWVIEGIAILESVLGYFAKGELIVQKSGHHLIYINNQIYGFQDELKMEMPYGNYTYFLSKNHSSSWSGPYQVYVEWWDNDTKKITATVKMLLLQIENSMRKLYLPICLLFLWTVQLQCLFAQESDFPMGCLFDKKRYAQTPVNVPLMRGSFDVLPSRHSLKKYCPKTRKQNYRDCSVWAVAYGAQTIQAAVQNNWTDASRINQEAFATAYLYNTIGNSCQAGVYVEDVLEHLKTTGNVKYHQIEDSCPLSNLSHYEQEAGNYRIYDYQPLQHKTGGEVDILALKKSLYENHPVVIIVDVYHSFFRPCMGKEVWNGDRSQLYAESGHALTVVAYDDAKFGGVFQVMNSWVKKDRQQEGWGKDNFIWIRYADFEAIVEGGYELLDDIETQQDFSVDIRLELQNGEVMPIRQEKNHVFQTVTAYESGTSFRFYLQNNAPTYLYAISSDLTNDTEQIFPHNSLVSPHIPYQNSKIAYPDEFNVITLNEVTGNGLFVFCLHQKTD